MKPKYGYKVHYKGQEVSGGGLFPTKSSAEKYAKGFEKTFDKIEPKEIKVVKRMKF